MKFGRSQTPSLKSAKSKVSLSWKDIYLAWSGQYVIKTERKMEIGYK